VTTYYEVKISAEDQEQADTILNCLVEKGLVTGGHQLKLRGGQPSDDDPESRKVIWGHTMISNPEVLVHFMICHYMERYFAVGLADHGSELALEKDFMLNALIDVVILDHLNGNRFANIYDIWRRSKDERGLRWINDDRLASYESLVAK
jgi:hypothetical protein